MSDYCEREDIEAQYGAANVAKWADLENTANSTLIDARVAWSIAAATEEINDQLRHGPYEIPFATPPGKIVRLCAQKAGLLLYELRGAVDFDADGAAQDQYQHQRAAFDKDLKRIHARQIRLDVAPAAVSYPQVIIDDDA